MRLHVIVRFCAQGNDKALFNVLLLQKEMLQTNVNIGFCRAVSPRAVKHAISLSGSGIRRRMEGKAAGQISLLTMTQHFSQLLSRAAESFKGHQFIEALTEGTLIQIL